MRKSDKDTQWGTLEYTRVVTIQGAKHLRKLTLAALTKTFNSDKPKHVENRPNGTNAKMVPWHGDARSPTPTREKLEVAIIARNKHRTWQENVTHIDLDTVEHLYVPIKTPVEGEMTLQQVLILIWSKTNYACNIFQAVNQNTATGLITALFHSGYAEEANEIMMNLAALCKECFGKNTKLWFTGLLRRL